MSALLLSRGILRLIGLCLFLAFTAFPFTPSFGENFQVPGDKAKTISQAMDLAERNSDSSNIIEVATGTYTETLTVENDPENPTVSKSLTIRGDDGAKVVIRAASDPLVLIGGPSTSVTLANLILSTSGTGIRINTSANVILRNLVITLASTAIRCDVATTTVSIDHVTFVQVTNGVDCRDATIPIRNNIFSVVSGTPIFPFTAVGATLPNFNLFHAATGPRGERGDNEVDNDGGSLDPLFVDSANNDFHLQEGSAAQDETATGDDDLGAYGGLLAAESVPFPPAQPTVSCGDPDATTCKVTWKKNLDHRVQGYLVLTSAPSAPNPDYGPPTPVLNTDPLCVASATDCSAEFGSLLGFSADPAQPATPTARFGDSRVQLDWPTVTDATEYDVYVATDPALIVPGTPTFTVSPPTKTVENLTNGVVYYFAVGAVSRPQFYAAVKSVYGTVSGTVTVGVSELSVPADPTDTQARYGVARFGALSDVVSATPLEVVGFPPLEDSGGCFIATAAYGSPLAPQVDVLRTFRERYLRPHAPGRAIIRVYEKWSPPLAEMVRSSEVLRLVVRVILWPIVGVAWMPLHGSWWVLLIPGVVIIIVWFGLLRRRGAVRA